MAGFNSHLFGTCFLEFYCREKTLDSCAIKERRYISLWRSLKQKIETRPSSSNQPSEQKVDEARKPEKISLLSLRSQSRALTISNSMELNWLFLFTPFLF